MKCLVLALIKNEYHRRSNPYQGSSNHQTHVYGSERLSSLLYVAQVVIVCILLKLRDLVGCEVCSAILDHLLRIQIQSYKFL